MNQQIKVLVVPAIVKIPHVRTVFLVIGAWITNYFAQLCAHFSVGEFFTTLASILSSAVGAYALYDIHLKVKWKHEKRREEQERKEKEAEENRNDECEGK